jgi:hypothetical protein
LLAAVVAVEAVLLAVMVEIHLEEHRVEQVVAQLLLVERHLRVEVEGKMEELVVLEVL